MSIAEWVRDTRCDYGWSKAALASKTGLALTSVDRIEAGRARPSQRTCLKLSVALGAPLAEVLLMAGHVPDDVQDWVRTEFGQRVVRALAKMPRARVEALLRTWEAA